MLYLNEKKVNEEKIREKMKKKGNKKFIFFKIYLDEEKMRVIVKWHIYFYCNKE